MANKEEFYKRIKIAGMISYIPIMLAVSPLAGFFLGDYLQKRFNLPFYVLVICIGAGIAVGIRESIRIIRLVSEIDKKE
ncbi:MAG: AtpZ/AtpI family protein [Candidatus Omnitrophica bacterium]|nr:AtpZ/AtpI family protein [Candidatus Omnitrophota bacterium]